MTTKYIRLLSAFTLAAALLIPIASQSAHADDACTVRVLKTSYGFSSAGYIAFGGVPPLPIGSFSPIAVAGTIRFQANQTVSRSVIVNLAGQVFPVVDSGTYTLNSDCTFTVNHGNGEVWTLIPVNHAAQLEFFVVSIPGAVGVGTGTLKAQETREK
jgi:uncharacterized protein (DUF2126 family)